MDVGSQNDLVTALNALAIVLSCAALAVSALAWFFSRAGKVRAFEARVYAQLTVANSRIETVESALQAHKLEITGLTDEMLDAADKAGKARRRIYAENQRRDQKEQRPTEDVGGGSREDELRKVRLRLAGGG